MPPQVTVATIVSAPFEENSYVIHLPGRDDCIVVDPGFEPDKIVEYLEEQGLRPSAFLLTHGHADHIAGNEFVKERWPDCPIVIGRLEAPMLTDAELNLSAPFGMAVTSPPADTLLDEGEIFRAAGMEFEARLIPGHSRGHMVYLLERFQPKYVFGGDVLFAGSVGRCDFPGGSFDTLAAGIHRVLFALPDDAVIFPGHGPATTIGDEKESNPFVGRPAGWRD